MTLPLDISRCAPNEPDSNCRQCARWDDLPGQTWGNWTPCFYLNGNSTSESCRYIATPKTNYAGTPGSKK